MGQRPRARRCPMVQASCSTDRHTYLHSNMNILFLHQNFPGQFVHIARALLAVGHHCLALVPATNNRPRIIPTATYAFTDDQTSSRDPADHYVKCVARGSAAAKAMLILKRGGFSADVVVGHCGWGEMLFVRDVWPYARVVTHAEFYYTSEGADAGFDKEFSDPPDLAAAIRLRARNAAMLQSLLDSDHIVAPTRWQASRFPKDVQARTKVIHEGIDTGIARPDPKASVGLGRHKLTLRPGDEVVSFVSRNLEPYRGFHSFMRALPRILRERPNARAVIVGGNKVSYGPKLKGQGWKARLLKEVGSQLDMERVHFVDVVPHDVFIQLMQVTSVHVYLTYPFVLSWSMLEAMACGAAVVGSRTAPVEEVIENRKNGLLVDFFDYDEIAETVVEALARPADLFDLRLSARDTVLERFDLKRVCLPAWLKIVCGETDQLKPGSNPAIDMSNSTKIVRGLNGASKSDSGIIRLRK